MSSPNFERIRQLYAPPDNENHIQPNGGGGLIAIDDLFGDNTDYDAIKRSEHSMLMQNLTAARARVIKLPARVLAAPKIAHML